ncbi:MAG: PEP/pyruvate-binding domain-containing protein [Planctomycetota bacterium]
MSDAPLPTREIPRFDRRFFASGEPLMRIGNGEIGGKAHGLAVAREFLGAAFPEDDAADLEVTIPQLTVITTDVFETFLDRNDLREVALSDLPDERIAHAFQQAALPTEIAGDLKALMDEVRSPLAVRSSSLLEDALFRPFAGVYETKMTPNNQSDPSERFRKLVEAIKFIWSSTFFKAPRDYIRTTDRVIADERMAVIIQEVVGCRHGDRYYPHLSGVSRSYNYYPLARAKPEEGVVNLALGLGKTIVDGGLTWSYAPPRPHVPPPFGSVRDQLKSTQAKFWAVNMGKPPAFNPITETEYLVEAGLADADYDGTLDLVASTYDAESDRLSPGVGADGPRVIDFAPLLQLHEYRLNDVIRKMLAASEDALQTPVEIEFATTFPHDRQPGPPRLGFLQVRPMVVSDAQVEITDEDLAAPDLLAASTRALGNGVDDQIADVVYVRPDQFHARHTPAVARQIESFNTALLLSQRPYLLIGFGRWGSSDPWLGIPVTWGQICGARAIIEATLPEMVVELSQGSHFFHNLSSFEVSYFMISHHARPGIAWSWLDRQPVLAETEYVRHVRLDRPLVVRVDGRSGHGVIQRPE